MRRKEASRDGSRAGGAGRLHHPSTPVYNANPPPSSPFSYLDLITIHSLFSLVTKCQPSSVPIATVISIERSTFCDMYDHIRKRSLSSAEPVEKATPASKMDRNVGH